MATRLTPAYHTCALYSNGGVKCWGDNTFGQLGYGHTDDVGDDAEEVGDGKLPFIDFGTVDPVVDIGAGHWHSCALFESGNIKCWGDNQAGALGNEQVGTLGDQAGEVASIETDYIQPTGLKPKAFSVIKRNVCVIYDDDSLRCSGQNDYGQAGTETFTSHGDAAGEMGDNLLPISLGDGVNAVEVITGDYHTCARLDNGSVKCWGRGDYGRLGYGNAAHRGGNTGDMGETLPAVNLGEGRTATQLYRGYFGNCAKLDDGTHKCWGANLQGELGVGTNDSAGDQGGEMGNDLAVFAPGVDIGSIHGGYHQWCLVTAACDLMCMGRNANGALGRGNTDSYGLNPGETWANSDPINLGTGRVVRGLSNANIAIGLLHMCALTDDFRVRCWGLNDSGQLFAGDLDDRGDAPGEMGDALPAYRP
jgi:alpha-tubulin suppressor-like RCC1 family protein